MSEQLKPTNEQLPDAVDYGDFDKAPKAHDPEKDNKQKDHDQLESIRKSIDTHSAKTETSVPTENHNIQPHDATTHRALKKTAYKKSLSQARSNMSVTERLVSKVIHRPGIERASNIGSKTVARPSGLLGGGIVMFIGSSALLFAAKRYGFTYNYSVIVILFVVGFFVGLALELVAGLLFKKRT